jgi:hypothetical protein
MRRYEFRAWVYDLYYNAIEERLFFFESSISLSDYFHQYKYWLKHQYRVLESKK